MWRVILALVAIGGFVFYFGYQEFKVSSGASEDPVPCELRVLETGGEPPDGHLEVGHHWAIYPAGIWWGKEGGTDIDYIYYPIVSEEHPYNRAWDELLARYGDAEPPEHEFPTLDSLGVLVKTKKFKSVSRVPKEWTEQSSIVGLITNEIEELKSEEKRLLEENFPDLYLDDVWILEEGREPKSTVTAMGMMAGGLLIIGVGVVVAAKRGLA